ncbi:DoxX family protein [Dawidia soli]|uniref:DoxX family protein n=1 Tax=Dawidia soli TaxID=2782352 RepID=A0AAP2D7G5_9BACT|nr:DoxX family protein [Dawidia soli]MBT1686006.1 DoxX family protein [Dawidia soli]
MSTRNKIIYWIATIWLSLGMVASGLVQLMHAPADGALSPPGVYGITQLGYPVYFLTIIGLWKILGVVALLVPKFALLKEWAYAGFVFLLTGAIYSHVATHHAIAELFPSALLLALTVLSWSFRPASRKVITANA